MRDMAQRYIIYNKYANIARVTRTLKRYSKVQLI